MIQLCLIRINVVLFASEDYLKDQSKRKILPKRGGSYPYLD